jgi:hypothetical protein
VSGHRQEFVKPLHSPLIPPLFALAVAATVGMFGGEAKAVIYPVFSRAALGGTDFIDWGSLGVPFVQIAHPPLTVKTNLNTDVGVTMVAGGDFLRLNETSDTNPWQGNFADGDKLLVTDTADTFYNPITLSTSTGYAGVGTNIQASANGPFVARVSVYDQASALLGTFDFNGNSDGNPGQAIFIGARSSTPSTSIYKVDFGLYSADKTRSNFAINQVDYTTAYENPTSNTVPAPLSILGIGAGFAYSRKLRARIKSSKLR